MSIFGKLLNFIPGVGPLLGMGADMLGGLGKASAQNQGNQLTAAAQQADLANRTSLANDSARQNAWKNLLQADYVKNNNQGYQPPTLHSSVPGVGDHALPTFGIARQPFGADAMAGARGMQNEAQQRLVNGPQLKAPDLYGMSKPSVWQKFLNVAAPAAKFGSQLNFGGGGSRPSGYDDFSGDE